MEIQRMIKDAMTTNRSEIERFQWAVMNGIGSLVYSAFISAIKQKIYPTPHMEIPQIKGVTSLLDPDGQLMRYLSETLIDDLVSEFDSVDGMDHKSIPELSMFTEDKIEILKTIFDLYIIPNVHRRIPEVIAKKFQIDPSHINTAMFESPEAVMFAGQSIDMYFEYLVQEICCQLLIKIPSIEILTRIPTDIEKIQLSKYEMLSINHPNAICPVIFNSAIFDMPIPLSLLSFVTNTSVHKISEYNEVQGILPDGDYIRYVASSNKSNDIYIHKFKF